MFRLMICFVFVYTNIVNWDAIGFCRRYFAVFSPGVLGTHYKRLMKNKHLLEVSQKSFPTTQSPYFPQL